MKTMDERMKEWNRKTGEGSREVAEKIEPLIDREIEEGRCYLMITPNVIIPLDPHYHQYEMTNKDKHEYFESLANLYIRHKFKVIPIQETGCGLDDIIYHRGFGVFWN